MELWYIQDYINEYKMGLKVKETIFQGKTRFQEIAILDTYLYGRTLLLDGIVQLSEKDEFMYHEMLVHVPMFSHPHPEKVLIIGGGDGGASREVLKHPVKEVTLVDIDEGVIEVCQKYFPQLGKWDDARLTVLIEDARQYVFSTSEVFDVIIMDSTDPLPRGVAEPLFTPEFFAQAFRCLSPQGIMVSQMEPPFFDVDRVQKLWKGFGAFPIVNLYWGLVPTYPGGIWSYVIASKSPDPREQKRLPSFPTRYYSPAIHQAAFVLPPFLEEMLKKQKEDEGSFS
ncbi:MAG TPA: polyamine aminopropyltransferase [Candidatus Atribacteria bacterium]|nr:polyamine aminopropyltransferase [Candidatus Atribacteria bacterium]HQE24975.1 polyamine aminopropyltransferase [Candidatus Atribacteria bacterium]